MKKDISIWNINSFGEFALQILEKYLPKYNSALSKLKEERRHFFSELRSISALRPIRSDANYIMLEVLQGKSKELAAYLLDKENILIKDLSSKKHIEAQYIRLAVRNREDNERLICSLRTFFKNNS